MKALRSSFWLHSIFYTLLQRFSLFFFGAVSYMLLVRAFGQDKGQMAVWALYLTILMIFETVKQGLLRNPTIKFLSLAEYAQKRKEVQSSALLINIGFSLLIVLLIVFCGNIFSSYLKAPALAPLLWWSFAVVALLIPFNHYEVLLQANYQFHRIFWAYLVRQGIFFGGIVAMFFFFRNQFTLLNLVLLQISSLLAGTIILYIATASYRLRAFHYDINIIRDMFHFGKYIFGTNLFYNMARSFDHFITANTLDPVSGKVYVSYYNAVGRINGMIDVPSLAAADVLFPKNVETLETDGLGKVKYYFERMIGTILALIVPIVLVIFLFPHFIIYVVAGKNYYGAVPILQVTILVSIVKPLGYQFGSTLDAIGKPVVNFWASGTFMAISLVTTYFCLWQFGGMGAAYATVINNIIGFFMMVFILKKYIHLQLRNIPKYMLMSYGQMYSIFQKVIQRLK